MDIRDEGGWWHCQGERCQMDHPLGGGSIRDCFDITHYLPGIETMLAFSNGGHCHRSFPVTVLNALNALMQLNEERVWFWFTVLG